jgi:hypothetical protein
MAQIVTAEGPLNSCLNSHYKRKESSDNEPDNFKGLGRNVTDCDRNVVVVLEIEQRLFIGQHDVVEWI